MLARTQEITAMRSSGISVQRIALPLLILAFAICGMTFIWNETLVPVFAHNAQTIYLTEIRNKQQQSLLGMLDIWIRGNSSFINIDNFDTRAGNAAKRDDFLPQSRFQPALAHRNTQGSMDQRGLEN